MKTLIIVFEDEVPDREILQDVVENRYCPDCDSELRLTREKGELPIDWRLETRHDDTCPVWQEMQALMHDD